MMWFDRQHPSVVYGDRRQETVMVTDRSRGNPSGQRTLSIQPDALMDFRALPFAGKKLFGGIEGPLVEVGARQTVQTPQAERLFAFYKRFVAKQTQSGEKEMQQVIP